MSGHCEHGIRPVTDCLVCVSAKTAAPAVSSWTEDRAGAALFIPDDARLLVEAMPQSMRKRASFAQIHALVKAGVRVVVQCHQCRHEAECETTTGPDFYCAYGDARRL